MRYIITGPKNAWATNKQLKKPVTIKQDYLPCALLGLAEGKKCANPPAGLGSQITTVRATNSGSHSKMTNTPTKYCQRVCRYQTLDIVINKY